MRKLSPPQLRRFQLRHISYSEWLAATADPAGLPKLLRDLLVKDESRLFSLEMSGVMVGRHGKGILLASFGDESH